MLAVAFHPAQEPFQLGLKGNAAGEQESLFTELDQRFRDVRTGPDGAVYLLTDSPSGQLLRVVPAN